MSVFFYLPSTCNNIFSIELSGIKNMLSIKYFLAVFIGYYSGLIMILLIKKYFKKFKCWLGYHDQIFVPYGYFTLSACRNCNRSPKIDNQELIK